jgi:hypothetical protein
MPFKLPLLEGLAIAVVALVCVAFQLRLPSQLPSESEYAEVEKVLAAEAQPDDALLLYPWWAERARTLAPEQLQVVGYQGSDDDDLETHPRVWVLAQPDLPRASMSDFMRAFGDRRTRIGEERSFGHLKLSLYQNGRTRPMRFSATDALANAQVYVEGPDGSRTPCRFDGRAHRCSNGGYVAVEWHEVHFQPRRCLRLFPPGGPGKMVADFSNVPQAESLSLYAGYIWDRGYFPDRTATDIVAEVNGTGVASINIPAGREGLQRAVAGAVPAGSNLRVWTRAANADLRETCVELYTFGSGAGS